MFTSLLLLARKNIAIYFKVEICVTLLQYFWRHDSATKAQNKTPRLHAERYVQAALNIQTIMIILTKNTWFHWLFWRMKWHIFSRLHDEKIWVWKRQFYKQDASLVWRQDAIQVANICKRLFRLHDDFFEILIFRAWERKIRWQKNANE